jgi:cyclic pyranopterin phosphate synthase
MTQARLFAFDEINDKLELVPLAARRVLDALGSKLSLEGWRSLTLEDRFALVQLGSAATIEESAARLILQRANPLPRAIDPIQDPQENEIPSPVVARLPPGFLLTKVAWSALSPLERWVLDKSSKSKNVEKFSLACAEILEQKSKLSHLSEAGEAHMVATTEKTVTTRTAIATSQVTLSAEAYQMLLEGNAKKGDVLGTARIAGIMAAKQTSQLIPLCHPIQITKVELTLTPSDRKVLILAEVVAVDRTGVEMEAMVAASVAALTVYDMLKAVDRSMVIGPTALLRKSGGKSGEFVR